MMTSYPTIRVRLDKGAYLPSRAHETDAGADVFSPVAFTVPGLGSHTLHTGVHVETPPNCATIIYPKSGLNIHHDIVAFGLIDEGYDGEVVVKLYNLGRDAYRFEVGDKVTQIVCVPVCYPTYVEADEIAAGERGSAGFGSTGRSIAGWPRP